MNPRSKKSIDGITPIPVRHNVYLAKRRLDALRTPTVSIQPHQQTGQLVSSRRRTMEPVVRSELRRRPVTSQKPVSSKPLDFKSNELVVNLPRKWSIRASLSLVVQYVITAAIAVVAAYSISIGQWFVLALAIYVLITRQDSRVTYGIGLFILISVPFFQLINLPAVSNNMAVYVFELLLLGTIQALIELKWPKWVDSHS